MHGDEQFSKGNEASRQVLKRLKGVIEKSAILDEPIPEDSFPSFFKNKGINYFGEEIHVAKKIRWECIAPSLPEQVGTLDIREFSDAGVLHYINNFEDFLVDVEKQVIGKTPSVMVDADQWEPVVEGLLNKGLCKSLPKSELHHIGGRCLFNGMFSVSKQEFQGDIEICRLILNFKPLNINCLGMDGDTCTLPAVSQMGGFYLSDGEVLTTSSEDIRCFFCLFRVPRTWEKFMGFGREIPPRLRPAGACDEPHFLCSSVLPVGFINSVSIAQHIHRNVVRRTLGSLQQPMGGHQEIRRDRVYNGHPNLFRIYLDNFD